jgi:hypothetical protein
MINAQVNSDVEALDFLYLHKTRISVHITFNIELF